MRQDCRYQSQRQSVPIMVLVHLVAAQLAGQVPLLSIPLMTLSDGTPLDRWADLYENSQGNSDDPPVRDCAQEEKQTKYADVDTRPGHP